MDLKQQKSYKNPFKAMLLSFIGIGFGQIYNDELVKGIIFIIFAAISISLMSCFIGYFIIPIIWICGIIDAVISARKINKRMSKKLK